MSQSIVQQSAVTNFGGTTATKSVTLTGVPAGARLMVGFFGWAGSVYPAVTVKTGTTDFVARRSNSGTAGGLISGEWHYLENVAADDYTIDVTHNGASGDRYGWFVAIAVTGGKATGGEMTACTKDGGLGSTTTSTPSVTSDAATPAAGMAFAVLMGNVSGSDAGIDAATGTPASWTNITTKQDNNAEAAGSIDYAPVGAGVTPSVGWGTLSAAGRIAALLIVFEDASTTQALAGGATGGATAAAANLDVTVHFGTGAANRSTFGFRRGGAA